MIVSKKSIPVALIFGHHNTVLTILLLFQRLFKLSRSDLFQNFRTLPNEFVKSYIISRRKFKLTKLFTKSN